MHFDLFEQISFVHGQNCVIERNTSHATVCLGRGLAELLKFLYDQVDHLLLFFVNEKVTHYCLIFVLQLEEDVG